MSAKWKISGLIGSVLVLTPIAVALAQPQAATCATINYRGLDEVAPGIFASSDVTVDQRLDFGRLHAAAKRRIADTFGATRASPVIVVGSTQALRQLFPGSSSYASTIYVPYRSCVIVGPEGRDVNILAHEELHAEIHHRVGHWYRLTEIPTWFDEGLAMQVDYRERYVWSPQSGAVESGSVNRDRALARDPKIPVPSTRAPWPSDPPSRRDSGCGISRGTPGVPDPRSSAPAPSVR